MGRENEEGAVAIQDRATGWISHYAQANRSNICAHYALNHFNGSAAVKRFFSDNAKELIMAAKQKKWPHDTSTPGRPKTNGVIERGIWFTAGVPASSPNASRRASRWQTSKFEYSIR